VIWWAKAAQHLVAGGVPVDVIDEFEVVEVHEGHAIGLDAALHQGLLLAQLAEDPMRLGMPVSGSSA
jgi:hypothetical protein